MYRNGEGASSHVSGSQDGCRLGIPDLVRVARGSLDERRFVEEARPALYRACDGDTESVHNLTIRIMHDARHLAPLVAPFFRPPRNLEVKVNGVSVVPFGTAAGMDKDAEALAVLGSIAGFQVFGTVTFNPRPGNGPGMRLVSDDANLAIFNAEGFPGKGLRHVLHNVSEFRKSPDFAVRLLGGRPRPVLYASVCGIPERNRMEKALTELEVIMKALAPHVEGFVWNPSCWTTESLDLLRDPSVFRDTAQEMKEIAPNHLRLVKMAPYEKDGKARQMALLHAFMDGGGHGVATTNTLRVGPGMLPDGVKDIWAHAHACESGRALAEYRMRSVRDARLEFPDSVIMASGGIFTGRDALKTFFAGANLVKGFSSYAFFGPDRARRIMEGVAKGVTASGYDSLASLQATVRDYAMSLKVLERA